MEAERWYLPILCHGRAQVRLEQLSRFVQQNQLYDLVPVAFIERKPRSQFYLFMAINSEQKSQIPDRLLSFVQQLGHPLFGAVEREDIEKMVSGPINPHDYARRITYRIEQEDVADDNPFDLFATQPTQHELISREKAQISTQYDKLLFWLSSVGGGTWQLFKNTCKTLGLDDSGVEARRILRKLRLLGHIEVSQDGSNWSVCPPSLVVIKHSPLQEYVLAGQRNIQLLETAKRLGSVQLSFVEQPGGLAPQAVHLHISSENVVEQLQEGIGSCYQISDVGMAASKLTEALPSLEGWIKCLPSVGKFAIALYDVEMFVDGSFIPGTFQGESGMYRLLLREANDRVNQTLFYHQGSNKWVQGDWYGLCFLALRQAGGTCRAVYHSATQRLALPTSQRWPEIYERALVLSSGQLPEENNNWLFFDNISRDLALQLTAKLAVVYEEIQ
jgi:hypothetical protein